MGGILGQLIGFGTSVAPALLNFETEGRRLRAENERQIALGQAQIAASARNTRTIAYVALGGGILFLAARKFA